jgi:tRNA/rRNA methyltransferase
MLTAEARARLTVVLVGARNPNNIGAAARAMQDFGFRDLRVVNEFAAPFDAAVLEASMLEAKSAVAAGEVMRAAQRFDSLAEAIADCTMVVGTTAVGDRQMKHAVVPVQQAGVEMLAAMSSDESRVALLFGSEKTGLTSEQLSFCNVLTTIPMYEPEGERHLSMNLGQSVAVCLYELTRAGFEGAKAIPAQHEAVASADDRERLTQLLLDVLHATGYTRRFPANASEPLVRQLAMQLGSTHREAMTWMGVLKQVLWRERGEG